MALPDRPAHGAEQGEWQAALEPRYGITYLEDRNPSGGGGVAQLSYGLSDSWAVDIVGGVTAHPLEASPTLPGGTLLTFSAMAGVTYSLDIVRIVPFFEAGLGLIGVRTDGPDGPRTDPHLGLMLGVGGDYLINRRWAVGVSLRAATFLTDPTRLPLHLNVGPRVTLRFGG